LVCLRGGQIGAKNAKQVEIRLAVLPKILQIAGLRAPKTARKGKNGRAKVVFAAILAGYG
jgi:hypothetical protein